MIARGRKSFVKRKTELIEDLNGELQQYCKIPIPSAGFVLKRLDDGRELKASGATVAAKEAAEIFGAAILTDFYGGRGSKHTVAKHPNGESNWPDYQVGDQRLDAKSVQHGGRRKWKAANLEHFKRRIDQGSTYYLDGILIEFDIEVLADEYVIHSSKAGNIWDFSRGGVSVSANSSPVIESTTALPYSAEDFCINLDRTTTDKKTQGDRSLHVELDRSLKVFERAGYL